MKVNLVRQPVFLEAYNRKDFDSTYSLCHRDSEFILPHQLVAMGFDPSPGVSRRAAAFNDAGTPTGAEFRIEPDEAIDFGDRVLMLGRIRGSGLRRGAGIETDWADLVTFAAGWVISEQVLLDRGEALAAVGLQE